MMPAFLTENEFKKEQGEMIRYFSDMYTTSPELKHSTLLQTFIFLMFKSDVCIYLSPFLTLSLAIMSQSSFCFHYLP